MIKAFTARPFQDSVILSSDQCRTLMNWFKETGAIRDITMASGRLLYRASLDGWTASDFHSCCDNKGSTLTVIKSENYIFGGYTEQEWKGKIKPLSLKTRFTLEEIFSDSSTLESVRIRRRLRSVFGILTVCMQRQLRKHLLWLYLKLTRLQVEKYPNARENRLHNKTLRIQTTSDSKFLRKMTEQESIKFGFVHLWVDAKSIR